ncbi:SRPBCC family protein [Tumebacillus lipolyticus]|uniref:SRPBCC family protein n=1 Tax=Tumebacillus lipolyticus TaxID=1280370 RepID=A0ABW4ZVA2_9BACL
MARVTCEVEIDAPVEQVWAVMQDPTRRGEWDYRITGGRFTKEGYPTKGAQFLTSGRLIVPYSFEMEYLAVTPYRQTVVKLLRAHRLPVASGAGSWTYLRNGAGTVVRTAFRIELKQPWRLLLDPWALQPLMYLVTKRSLRKLKRLIER